MSRPHRLLQRQIRKAGIDASTLEKLTPFLAMVDEAYQSFDHDISHIETILEKSSQELFLVNQRLKSNVESISHQLERVTGNINEVIFEIDLERNWIYLNPAWEELTGYTVAESLGNPYRSYLEDKSWDDARFIIFANGPQQSFRSRFEITTKHQEKKWVDVRVKKIMNDKNELEGYIGTIADITDLKKSEVQLIKANKVATLANKAKDEFLSTMSHEIRTPLNAVIGVSHLLLLENPKKEQLENLDALKYSSEHLLELVNDILDFNKIASGSIELEEADFSLDHILDSLRSIFHHKAKAKDIRFIISKSPELPATFQGDSTRLTQILTNLINNAIKFTEEGEVVLKIERDCPDEATCVLRFKVSDTGIGIPKDKHKKIFQTFAQAHSHTTRKYGGTGLGLAICKKLVELMGGHIHVESSSGKGAAFIFTIPLKESRNLYRPGPFSEAEEPFNVAEADSLKGVKILVAEDNHLNILVISKFLAQWHVVFDVAENGKEALHMAQKNPYDLILMDLQMPEMSGFDATKAIRSSQTANSDIPIYALSASTGVDINREIQLYGLDGLICKPFNPKDLHKTLAKIIHQSDAVER